MSGSRWIRICLCLTPIFAHAAFGQAPRATPPPSRIDARAVSFPSPLPGNTVAAAFVRDLSVLDAGLSDWATRIGVTVSPVSAALAWLEIVAGVEPAGSAAVALVRVEAGGAVQLRPVLIVPTAERKKVLAFLNPRPAADGVLAVTIRGQDAFAIARGGHTLFGPDRATIRAVEASGFLGSKRLAPNVLKRFGANDATIWVDVRALRATNAFDALPIWARTLLAASTADETLDAVLISTRFTSDGLAVALAMHTGGTTRASASTEDLLIGLPNDSFGLVLGTTATRDGGPMRFLIRAGVAALAATGRVDPLRVEPLVRVVQSSLRDVRSLSLSVSVVEAGGRRVPALAIVARTHGRAEALVNEIETVLSFLRRGVFGDYRLDGLTERLVLHRGVEHIDSVVVHHLSADLAEVEGLKHESLMRVFGSDGLTVRIGVCGADRLVASFGGGQARFGRIVANVGKGHSPLTDNSDIALARASMPEQRIADVYFSPSSWREAAALIGGLFDEVPQVRSSSEAKGPLAVALRMPAPGELEVELALSWEWLAGSGKAFLEPLIRPADPRDAR